MRIRLASSRHRLAIALAALLPVLMAASPKARAFTFTEINVPGALLTTAEGINADHDITGVYMDANFVFHGYVLVDGEFTDIDVPGAEFTNPLGINDSGDIVGAFGSNGVATRGFLLKDGMFTTIEFPGSLETVAGDINTKGEIVGEWVDELGIQHGFVRSPQGVYTSIDYPGAETTRALGINNKGEIVGESVVPFLLDKKKFIDLEVGEFGGFPNAINKGGVIAGTLFTETGDRGFILDKKDFTIVDVPGAQQTAIQGISQDGVIVGNHFVFGQLHAFVATP